MSQRINYAQAVATLDYAALNQKLERLSQADPPGSQNTALAMLEPLREKLLTLQRKGWSSQQLAAELKTAGVPVSAARVREALSRWTNTGKRRSNSRSKSTVGNETPPSVTNQNGRSKNAPSAGQPKFGLT